MNNLFRTMRLVVMVVMCVSLSLGFIGGLYGDILVSNLSEPINPNGPTVIGNTPFGPDNQAWAAQSFMTDDQSYFLNSIEAIMGNGSTLLIPIMVQLRRDTGTNEIDMLASGLITDFGFPEMNGPNQSRVFSLLDEIALQANTKYWFMVGIDSGNNSDTFEWEYANTGFFQGPGALTEFGFSEDLGATWSYPIQPFFPWTMQVNVAAVPEPSASILGVLSVAAVIFFRPGKRKI